MITHDTDRAIYGTVAAFGGWSVTYLPEGNAQNVCRSGYDREFPVDRFPRIPIVDFRPCDSFRWLKHVREAFHTPPRDSEPLADFLQHAVENGCAVYSALPQ